ncbi:MAG: tryptophan synthase subunit alpha [Planctomycetota bacterium]|jgi:tryptophan synthase alpha chain|nr:tryptophan synthase subunit alpha [Planctomycetota bacterium]
MNTQETTTKLMAHMIAGYPDMDASMTVAKALAVGGAEYIEVQFPYSDPTSDGPLIEKASQAALEKGFRVDAGFGLMRRLRAELEIPLFIMTYGSLVFARGVGKFCDDAAAAGVTGLIIPDLPPDYSEGLFEAGRERGLAVVPVIAPEISDERLRTVGDLRPEYVYTALRLGITGSRTTLDAATIRHLDRVAGLDAKVIAGFGVRSGEQMKALSGHAHAAAVGSFFLERLNAVLEKGGDAADALTRAARELR